MKVWNEEENLRIWVFIFSRSDILILTLIQNAYLHVT